MQYSILRGKITDKKISKKLLLTDKIESVNMIIADKKISVNGNFKEVKKMKTAKSVLHIDAKKLQLLMAEKLMNPYDLCSKAEISYQSYQRIVKTGSCKIATLGKLAAALDVGVTELLED